MQCDVAIIGAGGAGLRAACAAALGGLSVVCVSKVPATRSHTVAAQGGINAALGNRMPDDWRWHMFDTLKGGDGLCDEDAVAFMCERASAAIVELEHLGMAFTRAEDGRIYQRAYGGQYADYGRGGPAYRACAVADRTGHALLHTLYAQAKRVGVRFLEECFVTDLIFDAARACRGVHVWSVGDGEAFVLRAHRVVLATGGYGQAWAATTSSSICTGDGGGMALRAGLPLQDMEFVQFHPTSLYGSGVLITEGARGEGAVLKNAHGERFMQRYAPASMELSSRDVIARAMAVEIQEGRGCGKLKDHLHLDLTALPPEVVRSRLPSVLDIARKFAGVDALVEPVPVLPAVHYTMGGLSGNVEGDVLDLSGAPVPGLLAVGEAACASVHGANRLGCNSLLDLVVFGRAVGERCVRELKRGAPHGAVDARGVVERFKALPGKKGNASAASLRKELQQAMQAHAGIFRDAAVLKAGVEKVDAIASRFQDVRVADGGLLWNNELAGVLELENLLAQARAVLASALFREESRGAHWRVDFPGHDARFHAHTLAWWQEGKMQMDLKPVRGA